MATSQIKRMIGLTDYSYEEQDTGARWVDGKAIYKRTATQTQTGSDSVSINLTSWGADKVIDADILAIGGNYQFFTTYYQSNTDRLRIYRNVNILTLDSGASYPPKPTTWYVTLYYTKN